MSDRFWIAAAVLAAALGSTIVGVWASEYALAARPMVAMPTPLPPNADNGQRNRYAEAADVARLRAAERHDAVATAITAELLVIAVATSIAAAPIALRRLD